MKQFTDIGKCLFTDIGNSFTDIGKWFTDIGKSRDKCPFDTPYIRTFRWKLT